MHNQTIMKHFFQDLFTWYDIQRSLLPQIYFRPYIYENAVWQSYMSSLKLSRLWSAFNCTSTGSGNFATVFPLNRWVPRQPHDIYFSAVLSSFVMVVLAFIAFSLYYLSNGPISFNVFLERELMTGLCWFSSLGCGLLSTLKGFLDYLGTHLPCNWGSYVTHCFWTGMVFILLSWQTLCRPNYMPTRQMIQLVWERYVKPFLEEKF